MQKNEQREVDYTAALLQPELDLVTAAPHAARGRHTDGVFDDRYLCTQK